MEKGHGLCTERQGERKKRSEGIGQDCGEITGRGKTETEEMVKEGER